MLHCAPVVVTDRDRDARLDDELRRLAAAAGVAAPTLEVRTDTKRLALVRYSRDGVRLLVRPETLRLPTFINRVVMDTQVDVDGMEVYFRGWARACLRISQDPHLKTGASSTGTGSAAGRMRKSWR